MSTASAGIDESRVTDWLRARVPALAEPLTFDLIAGGRSNLTYRVADAAGTRWVLRRPPLGHVLATAHDMAREHRIIAALAGSPVPVPSLVGMCDDDSVIGAPFYVMDHCDGLVVRDEHVGAELDPEARRRVGFELVDVLAQIHGVDIDAVGLGDLARREGYVERQLSRWASQWQATKDGDDPAMDLLHDRLAASVPTQGPATIVHGDYRLDNCIVGADGTVRAVLDWELCTLGDRRADLGLMLVYWVGPDDAVDLGIPAATRLPGFPTRDELLARYVERTGVDVGEVGWFQAFGYWKLAVILQGVLVRYRAGAMGDDGDDGSGFTVLVRRLADAGLAALDAQGTVV